MKTKIKSKHVCWFMEYNDSEKEMVFEEEQALAFLLSTDVLFLNTHWYKKDWNEEQQSLFCVLVNCNDVFYWGSADAEEIKSDDMNTLWNYYCKDKIWGPAIWCIKQRGMMPQKPVYDDIMEKGTWNLDKMKLEPNPSWPENKK